MPGRRAPLLGALVVSGALLATAGCTATSVDPQRARTVVVSVDVPFESLNAATTAGRTPGSTLVRGLVQDRFTTVDETGAALPDRAIGTVEKVSDDPLTVRYTIAATARWSDGVPVTGDDLLLEWAARSGQLDEAPPAGAGGAAGQSPTPTSPAAGTSVPPSAGGPSVEAGTASAGSTAPTGGAAAPAADTVWFGAVSPVLVHAPAIPTVDEHGLTLVYADRVADWQSALDVNLAAHVVGRLALGGDTGATPTSPSPGATGAPSGATSTAAADAAHWSALVTTAIQHADRAALVPVSRVWRTAAEASTLHDDPAAAVTTGPYRLDAVDPGKRVELVRNASYSGARPAAFDRVVVRSDLDPLSQVAALRAGTVDVVAPVATADVRSALQKVPDVRTSTGGGAVLQLQLQESGGGAFDAARWASGGDDGRARAAALRSAFVAAVDRSRLAGSANGSVSDAVLATVGPGTSSGTVAASPTAAPTATPAPTPTLTPTLAPTGSTGASAGGSDGPATPTASSPSAAAVPVRVLVSTDDEVRRQLLATLTQQLATAGFTVTQARPADPATALWADPGSWDVALVPVPQSATPVASVLARWRTGGATNVTAHRDPALDAQLDAAAAQTDPAALRAALAGVGTALSASDVVVPLVRQPVLAATVGVGTATASPDGRPRLPQVPAIPWGDTDLTSWWSWASTAA